MIALALRFWWAPVIALALTFAGIQANRLKSAHGDRDRWKATAGQYLKGAKAWEASYREDARLRGLERSEAIGALNASSKACDARVAVARRSSVAIQSIVTKETTYDQAHCPVRSVVGARELSDAIGITPAR